VFRLFFAINGPDAAEDAAGGSISGVIQAGVELRPDYSGSSTPAIPHHAQKGFDSAVPSPPLETPPSSTTERTFSGSETFFLWDEREGDGRPDWLSPDHGTLLWTFKMPGEIANYNSSGADHGLLINSELGYFLWPKGTPQFYDGTNNTSFPTSLRTVTEGLNKFAVSVRNNRYLLASNGQVKTGVGGGSNILASDWVEVYYGLYHDIRFFPQSLDQRQLEIVTS
jgi:hypothetical protein